MNKLTFPKILNIELYKITTCRFELIINSRKLFLDRRHNNEGIIKWCSKLSLIYNGLKVYRIVTGHLHIHDQKLMYKKLTRCGLFHAYLF